MCGGSGANLFHCYHAHHFFNPYQNEKENEKMVLQSSLHTEAAMMMSCTANACAVYSFHPKCIIISSHFSSSWQWHSLHFIYASECHCKKRLLQIFYPFTLQIEMVKIDPKWNGVNECVYLWTTAKLLILLNNKKKDALFLFDEKSKYTTTTTTNLKAAVGERLFSCFLQIPSGADVDEKATTTKRTTANAPQAVSRLSVSVPLAMLLLSRVRFWK